MEMNLNDEINTSKDFEKRNSIDIDYEDEEILFIHNLYGVRKLCFIKNEKDKKPFNLLNKNIFAENTKIDSNEIEIIKTDQYLNILNPKIVKYLTYKDIDFNCTFLKNLYSYSEEIGFENTIGCLFPLVKELSFRRNIKPILILSFLEGFEKFLNFLLKREEGYKIVIDNIVPLINDIITTKKEENLLKAASKALILIIQNSKEEEKCSVLLPILIILAHDDSNIKGQLLAIEIFNSISFELGENITENYIVPQLESFFEDSREDIRICTIKNLINICKVISYDCFIHKIFPYYKKLFKDHYWLIRRFSFESLPSICKICKSDFISTELSQLFIEGTKDSEIQVKLIILSIFSEFIYFLEKKDLENNNQLLEFYINNVIDLFKNKKSENINFLYKIAFSLPGVILTYCQKVSKNLWDEIKKVYFLFFEEKDLKIKTTISSSFAEISKIIGNENSEKDIAPRILTLYENNNILIKNTILNNLPEFLKSIKDENLKKSFLKCFTSFNEKKWREKIKFLKILGKLKDIYNIDIISKEIFPLVLKMNFETVNKVRIRAAKELSGYLYKYTQTNDEFKINALILLQTFGTCIHYHYRQLFIYISISFMINENEFMEIIFPLLYDLSFDKIDNVRMTISKILNKIIKKNKNEYNWILNNKDMKEIIFRLKNDKAKEVRDYIKDIEINEDYSNVQIGQKILDKINEKFNDKMDVIQDVYKINPVSLGSNLWLNKENIQ